MNSREQFLAALTTVELQQQTGCAISPRCPNANLQPMVNAVPKWLADRNQ
jgi:hypothetical protein